MTFSRHKKGRSSYYIGLIVEYLSEIWLRCKGYRILKRRFRTPVGEIDLLATSGAYLVLVEVKWRKQPELVTSAISVKQQQRLVRAARYCQATLPAPVLSGRTIRFDAILWTKGRLPLHLKSVWGNDN